MERLDLLVRRRRLTLNARHHLVKIYAAISCFLFDLNGSRLRLIQSSWRDALVERLGRHGRHGKALKQFHFASLALRLEELGYG